MDFLSMMGKEFGVGKLKMEDKVFYCKDFKYVDKLALEV